MSNGPISIAEEALRRAHEQWNRIDEEPAHAITFGERSPIGDRFVSPEAIVEKPESEFVPPEVAIMEPIFRFFQLLCENHNRDLQVSPQMFGRVYIIDF